MNPSAIGDTFRTAETASPFAVASAAAITRYYARHAQADDIQHNSAAFTWNRIAEVFEIEVCGYIVAECPTLAGVITFSLMHNSRLTTLKP